MNKRKNGSCFEQQADFNRYV